MPWSNLGLRHCLKQLLDRGVLFAVAYDWYQDKKKTTKKTTNMYPP